VKCGPEDLLFRAFFNDLMKCKQSEPDARF